MALDALEVVTAPFGHIYLGKGAGVKSRPATLLATPSATDYDELGYANEDGVSFTPSTDSEDIRAWQSLPPVKTVLTESGLEVAFTLIQTNEAALQAFFNFSDLTSDGGTASMDIASNPASQERSLLVRWNDDEDNDYELYFARAFCTDREELALQRGEAQAYGLTFRTLDNSGTLGQFRSNNPALLFAS